MGPLELEEWAGSLEDHNLALQDRIKELELTKAAYERTILAKNVELKRLREGIAEVAVHYPHLTNWANDLVRGS